MSGPPAKRRRRNASCATVRRKVFGKTLVSARVFADNGGEMIIEMMGGRGRQTITRAELDRLQAKVNELRRAKRLVKALAESMATRKENGAEVEGPAELEVDYYVVRGERVRAVSLNGVEVYRSTETPSTEMVLRERYG